MNLKTSCYFAFLFPSITFAWLQFAALTQSSLRLRTSQLSSSRVTRNVGLQASDDDDDEFISEQKAMFEINESESIGERSRLISESIAPWRTLRLFLYGSAASGAFVGGLITLTGAIAAMNGRGLRTDVDLNTEYLNLAIDFGAVAVFAIAAKFDLDKGSQLNEKVEAKLTRKKDQKSIVNKMRQREKSLQKLNLSFQIDTDGNCMESTIDSIQGGAKQHIIIVAGSKKANKDALLGANLLKLDFAMSNILVVPYYIDDKGKNLKLPRSGFGEDTRPTWETAPYVASTVGEGWNTYIDSEFDDAIKQDSNGDVNKLKEEGIVIVLANDGKVIRRGVGKVPWRQMVTELEESVKPVEKIEKDDVFL